jgi:hypothetical protein
VEFGGASIPINRLENFFAHCGNLVNDILIFVKSVRLVLRCSMIIERNFAAIVAGKSMKKLIYMK